MPAELEMALTLATNVRVEGNRLIHGLLGHSVQAPPKILTATSTTGEVEAAKTAVAYGLIEAKLSGRKTLLRKLHAEVSLPLKAVTVTALPQPVFPAVLATSRSFVNGHGPLVILIGSLAVASLFFGRGLLHATLWVTIILLSFLVHELGHVVAFKLLSPGGHVVFVMSRTEPRVVRLSLTARRDALVAVAGPLAPLLATVAMLPVLRFSLPELVVSSVVALGHALSLLIRQGDGAELRSAISTIRGGVA